MAEPSEYKILSGNVRDVQIQLQVHAKDGWKPVLMSSFVASTPAAQAQLVIVLELVGK